MYLDFPLSKGVEWKGGEFKKMESLKTLIVKTCHFSKAPTHLPNSLRVLEWHRYPSRDIPANFFPKKLSICKLRKSCLTSFEFPGSLKAGMFVDMRVLNLDKCKCLTQIHDVSGLQNLEEFSFQKCKNLITIHDSVGYLNKLKILDVEGCSKLRSFPPIHLTSLQQLKLSHCNRLKSFPEILGKIKNLEVIVLVGTSIEELPNSFQNLTRVQSLYLEGGGMLRLPSSIIMMPELSWIIARGCRLIPKQNDKLSSNISSNILLLELKKCNLSDEFLPIGLPLFANTKELDLSGNNFTILPECLKECRFLRSLYLDNCKCLREIRGIPPNLKRLSTKHCKSLTSSCRSMLLNQELHEAGGTRFCLAGTTRIPEWFEHQSRGPSISFRFRSKIPSVALFLVFNSMHNECPNGDFIYLRANLIINGYKYSINDRYDAIYLEIKPDHTYLYDLNIQGRVLLGNLDGALLRNEWIHAKVTYGDWFMISPIVESGIHVFKHRSSMADIQFTNPYEQIKIR